MDILQVTPSFYPALEIGGGVPRVAYEISTQLAKNGHNLSVFTTEMFQKPGYEKIVKSNQNLKNIEIKYSNIKYELLSQNKFYYTPEIKNYLKQNSKFEIIHCHDFRTYQNIEIYNFCLENKIPYVIQTHGSVPILTKKIPKKIFDIFYGKKILKNASKIIALTNSEALIFKNNYHIHSDKIEILPNGINLNYCQEIKKYGKFRERYNIPIEDKIIIYIGRLHSSKRLDILLDAFENLIKKHDNYWLIIIGPDSDYHYELKIRISQFKQKNKIIICGVLSENEKNEGLVDSNIMVIPAFYGFPIAFLEAMAVGLPIITTDFGDRLDWIKKIGKITSVNSEEVEKAILEISNSDELRKKIKETEKRFIEETFNWVSITNKLEKIYKNILNH